MVDQAQQVKLLYKYHKTYTVVVLVICTNLATSFTGPRFATGCPYPGQTIWEFPMDTGNINAWPFSHLKKIATVRTFLEVIKLQGGAPNFAKLVQTTTLGSNMTRNWWWFMGFMVIIIVAMVFTKPTCNWRVPPCRTEFHPQTCGSISSLGANNASSSTCSYGHLLVITCYFYGIIHSINKGFLSTYNWYNSGLNCVDFQTKNCERESPNRQTARCTGQASPSETHIIKPFHCHTCFFPA